MKAKKSDPLHSERVHFRCIVCPECSNLYQWLGTRDPSYCPECGRPMLRHLRDAANDISKMIVVNDPKARISYVKSAS